MSDTGMPPQLKVRGSGFPIFWLMMLILVPLSVSVIMNLELLLNLEKPPKDYGTGSMFDTIASRYDLINRVLALRMDVGWRRKMVSVIKDRVSDIDKPVLLDLATGTADVAIMLGKKIPNAEVFGTDPSSGMLHIGRDKVKKEHLNERVRLLWGDARELSTFGDNYGDGATMSFGIRNVPEPREIALCEIHRILKPNSVFTILEFSEPDENSGLLGSVARSFIRYVVPMVGGVLSGNPKEYLHLQNSIKDFPPPKEFGKLLETLKCGPSQDGYFVLDDLVQMNFGSVQLYITTSVKGTGGERSEMLEEEVQGEAEYVQDEF